MTRPSHTHATPTSEPRARATTRRTPRRFAGLAAFFGAALGVTSWAGCEPMGGCVFTEVSDVKVSPASAGACLSVSLYDGYTAESPGGCVNPTLHGENGCAEALVFAAEWSVSGEEVEVAPGASFVLEVDAGKATNHEAHSTGEADRAFFQLPASLGTEPIVFSFSVWRD